MGWKLSSIIYKPQNKNIATLVKQIENSKRGIEYLKVGKTTFGECMNPTKDDLLYIGEYQDFVIVTEAEMPFDFFQETATKTERFWRTLSRDSQDVYSFILNSTACMYGYAYLSNQRKIRCKWGTLDDSVILEMGNPLDIEEAYIEKNDIDFLLEEEEIEFHQIGEDLVFYFLEKLLGGRPDKGTESDLMDIEMTIYKKEIVDDFDYTFS